MDQKDQQIKKFFILFLKLDASRRNSFWDGKFRRMADLLENTLYETVAKAKLG